jgi:hypothetical protein
VLTQNFTLLLEIVGGTSYVASTSRSVSLMSTSIYNKTNATPDATAAAVCLPAFGLAAQMGRRFALAERCAP